MSHFVWNIDPEIFRIGSFGPRYYGLFFALGFLVGYHVMVRVFEREGKDPEQLSSLLFHVMVGTIVGARLGHVLFYEPEMLLENPLSVFAIWQGGLASHGGTIGVIIGTWLWLRKNPSIPLIWLADRLAPSICFAAGCIRLGNFFNSEIIGKPSDVPWAIVFQRVDNLPRHPAMLYESFTYFVLAFILYAIYWQRGSKQPYGFSIGFLFTFVFLARILIETVKENQVSFENGMFMNMGQILSIPFVLLGILLMTGVYRKWVPVDENGFVRRQGQSTPKGTSKPATSGTKRRQ